MTESKKKTTAKIQNSLMKMLKSMPIESITATALCEYASVNRATFYYHYDSVQDVLAEIEANLESEFVQWMTQTTINSNGLPEKSFYVSFFEFVVRNADICRLILNTQRQSDFLTRAIEAGRAKVVSDMSKLFITCPVAKINYFYMFVSNGFLGMLGYWLNSGMRESVTEIAAICERIAYAGVGYLNEK